MPIETRSVEIGSVELECSDVRDCASCIAIDRFSKGARWRSYALVLGCCVPIMACSPPAYDAQVPIPVEAERSSTSSETNDDIATGNRSMDEQLALQHQVEAATDEMRRAIKLPDPSRPVDHEAARILAKGVPGVRSAVWIDRENLLAIVVENAQRSHATIDAICLALEPLGDTLGVVVNLQSGAAKTGDELEILSRNCQLAPGDRAFLQQERKIDAIAPTVRMQHRANQTQQSQRDDERLRRQQQESQRILEQTTPEM